MATTRAKGHEFETFIVDSFSRRAIQFMNHIIKALNSLGVPESQIDVPMEKFALKNAPASVLWFMDGHRMYYSYESAPKFVENLYVISKVIALEVDAVIHKRKTIQDFISEFSEEEDIDEQRKEAREILGVHPETKDLDAINKRYKALARKHHPDTPTGNPEKFKAINHAHKTLKRELE
ncbi:MAG TPA: DnaJ domain-containing protein [Candidatus Nanoarchaeia archaeon]|nr:DnaJ domain-containing protein [Candidatus Nanoarchaeia archaeon]